MRFPNNAKAEQHSQQQQGLLEDAVSWRQDEQPKGSLTILQIFLLTSTLTSLLLLGLWPMIPSLTNYPFTDSEVGPAKTPADESSTEGLSSLEGVHDANGTSQPDKLQDRYTLPMDWAFDSSPQRREYWWVVRDAIYNPDGVFRPMMLINDQFPGPMIRVNEGDVVIVHVDNQAKNATSIHWHGMYQQGSPWMDGTVGISSCPIAPGRQFTYEFNVTGQSGSYFYHAHQGIQAADGLYGPLIIHSKDEAPDQKLQYSTDRVLMVSDYYYDQSNVLLIDYLKPDNENAEPVPVAALINGKSVRDCDTVPNRNCNNKTANVQMPTLELDPDKAHRLRIIHTGVFAEMQVSIDQHEFGVVEVDGVDTLPVYFDRLKIHPAQRYSVVVRPNTTVANMVWLRVKMLSTCFAEQLTETEAETRAIVSFGSTSSHVDPDILPQSVDWAMNVDLECRDMNTSALVPAVAIDAPRRANASFYLRSNFEIGAYRLSRGFFNSSSWRADVQSPSLYRTIEGLRSDNRTFANATIAPGSSAAALVNIDAFDVSKELVIQTNGTQIVDLLISNFDDGSHSMHLHGYKFFVLAQGHGYPPENLTETLDLSNPLRRDTATVEAFGWMLVRFIADNPGAWAFHCHVSWHAEAGLMMQFITRVDELAKMEIPEANIALCGAPRSELERGMAPPDETWYYE